MRKRGWEGGWWFWSLDSELRGGSAMLEAQGSTLPRSPSGLGLVVITAVGGRKRKAFSESSAS